MSDTTDLFDEVVSDEVATDSAALLSRYLQFDTTNPPGNERPALEFLADILTERGFTVQLLESAPQRANLIARLPATTTPTQPSIVLYSHADVVSADGAEWSHPPFAGEIADGFVWGRGAIDNKGLGIIFVQALTLLKQQAVPRQRDLILCVAADEEADSQHGVAWLLDQHLDLLQAEFVWDEGGTALQFPPRHSPPLYAIAIAEKQAAVLTLRVKGTPGHASLPDLDNPQDRLVEALYRLRRRASLPRLTRVVTQMLHTLAPHQPFPRSKLFANAHRSIVWPSLLTVLKHDPIFAPLIVNTLNLTMLNGGQTSNAVPSSAQAKLDLRLLPEEDLTEFLNYLRVVINDPTVTLEAETPTPPTSPISSMETAFYRTLSETLMHVGPTGVVTPYLTPGATDSRFFRQAGMQAYGFMPLLLSTKELRRIHGIDERVAVQNLRWGIGIVYETLRRLVAEPPIDS